jgi:iron complex transport system substrate-binding protein
MMKKWWLLLIALFLLSTGLVISGIRQSQKQAPTALPENAERIVSLAPSLTEILFALGLGDKITGVTLNCDYPPEALQKPKVGSYWQPDTEAVIAAKPDLVITLRIPQHENIANSLKGLGYRVLVLKIEKIKELPIAIREIGITTGSEQNAEKLIENINNKLDSLKSKYSSPNKLKVLWVIQTEPLRVVGRNTFINELIELLGAGNAIGPTIQQYPPISTEELLACNAEIIIQSAMGKADISVQQQQAEVFWNQWPGLAAVKNKKVYVVDSDTVLRLGPRLPQGIEMIGQRLYPDAAIKHNETK